MTDPELERIRREYDRRAADPRYADRYAVDDPANAMAINERQRAARALLRRHGFGDLAPLDILDVGCGSGGELRRMVDEGADRGRLVGIDLLPARLAGNDGGFALAVADAAHMPFDDGSFDLAMLFTVLSSVLDERLRRAISAEVSRVLRPGGALLWYDFRWNPTNRQTRGLDARHVRGLFPTFRHDGSSVTLAPPLARVVAPRSSSVARTLGRVSLLRSHTIGLAIKPGDR